MVRVFRSLANPLANNFEGALVKLPRIFSLEKNPWQIWQIGALGRDSVLTVCELFRRECRRGDLSFRQGLFGPDSALRGLLSPRSPRHTCPPFRNHFLRRDPTRTVTVNRDAETNLRNMIDELLGRAKRRRSVGSSHGLQSM